MDGTQQAFETVVAAHLRHGTTSIAPTTTVARADQLLAVLELCRQWRLGRLPGGARVLGAHLYGPYFNYDARGCHPGANIRPPVAAEFEQYLEYADSLVTATVAPELPGAEAFVRACEQRGVRTNVGHSQATFAQMADAVRWGVRHVDHLYCAMSDKTKLRQQQPYPMQGGVLEATLYFDELTTEVIADGKHLTADLLLLALKIKGADRLALVTDCNRALDLPDGEYVFGPTDGGEPFIRRDQVGVMPDGQALASAVCGMDHMVRTFAELTGRPIWEVVRLATLTPARIAGRDHEIGSIELGKRADLLILDRRLTVRRVLIDGLEAATIEK
jgi:N-acetylglucosamine-6-phosphate deacetylase